MHAVNVAVLLVVRILDLAVEDLGLIEQLAVADSKQSNVSEKSLKSKYVWIDTYKHNTRSSFAYIGCPLAAGAMAKAEGGV